MEVVITENNQVNGNISFADVYYGIRDIKPEYQAALLENYKLFDLYTIIVNDEEYFKHLTSLTNNAAIYTRLTDAFADLRSNVLKRNQVSEGIDLLDSMRKVYDMLPEVCKKKFCEDMLNRKDFFSDAYKVMMDYFQDTLKSQKENNIEAGESVKE